MGAEMVRMVENTSMMSNFGLSCIFSIDSP